jgi:pimeloyl-ACP methyl ester carboxylesterase
MRGLLETAFTPQWIDANADTVAKALNVSTTPPFAQQLHYVASEGHDSWDLLPTIKAPTLVIHGSDDLINPTANANLLASRIPHAEVYIVEGGRHGYFIKFEAEVNRVIKDFLGRHPL